MQRALDTRAMEAAVEVEGILDAAPKVIHRVEPTSRRGADIIAGTTTSAR